ncbi:RICIN domain-containing protein [Streptomyces lasalocidi]
MTDQNITISNNLVTGVAQDYKDMPGILSTYVSHAVITHNEVSNLGYDGIDVGWGWGINDRGGSQDYVNRGTYNYQPIYTTPTTLNKTIVTYNKVHDTKKVFHDGGSIYNLSANPGGFIADNYVYDNHNTVGLYLDEGSGYITLQNNVLQDTGVWANTNASANNNTDDNTFADNWYNAGATVVATGSPHNNVLTGNVQVSGYNWPAGAQEVIAQAGVTTNSGIGTTAIHAVGADKCIDDNNWSITPGTQQQIWDCNGQSNQTWTHNSANEITLFNGSSQMCLDDAGWGTTNGTAANIWTCTGQVNQQWRLNPDGTITNVYSGLCLDVSNNGTSNGTKIQLWSCNSQANQEWNLG